MATSSFSGTPQYGQKFSGYGTDSSLFTHFGSAPTSSGPAATAPTITPVSPTYDPKIDANALYGKPIILSALGYARIGATSAPLLLGDLNDGKADFIVSFGFAVPITGNRKIYKIFLDQERWWSSVTGWDGSGALPGDSIFHGEAADIAFRPGTLTQAVLSLETLLFPGTENAYRPEMLLEIRGLPIARYVALSGRPVPYVAAEIGDVTGGADPLDGINLGLAVERIAHSPWPKYSSSTFEAVGITDVVAGLIIAENFTVIQICQSITNYYRNIHLLQSDKLRIKDHGSNVTPDIVFTRDTIIGGENAVAITRAGPSTQRREDELIAIDPDQDYTRVPSIARRARDPIAVSSAVGKSTGTLPLIINADTRQALVTFAQYEKENARKRISLRVPIYGYQIEPGDRMAHVDLADGIDNEVMLVEETSHNGDFTVNVEARAILRCSFFTNPEAAHVQCQNAEIVAASNKTFTPVDFGEAHVARRIVVGINLRMVAAGQTITSVTIGGVAATEAAVASNAGEGLISAVYFAAVPTGTSGSVVINTSGNFEQVSIHAYRLVSASFALSDFDSAQATTASAVSATLDVPAGGVSIAAAATRLGASFTWAGATESCTFVNDVQTTGQRSSAMHLASGAELGSVISVDPSSVDRVTIAAASFVL